MPHRIRRHSYVYSISMSIPASFNDARRHLHIHNVTSPIESPQEGPFRSHYGYSVAVLRVSRFADGEGHITVLDHMLDLLAHCKS
jgi:hypothetical protein